MYTLVINTACRKIHQYKKSHDTFHSQVTSHCQVWLPDRKLAWTSHLENIYPIFNSMTPIFRIPTDTSHITTQDSLGPWPFAASIAADAGRISEFGVQNGRKHVWINIVLLQPHLGGYGYGSIPIHTSYLGGWASINPSYFDVNYRGTRVWHTAICLPQLNWSVLKYFDIFRHYHGCLNDKNIST